MHLAQRLTMPVTAPPYCVNRAPPAGDAVAGPGVRYGRRDYRSPGCGLSGGGCPRRVMPAQSPRAHPLADLGCARGQPGGGGVGSELLRAGAGQPGARHRRLRRLERGFCGARCAPSLGLWLSRSTTSTPVSSQSSVSAAADAVSGFCAAFCCHAEWRALRSYASFAGCVVETMPSTPVQELSLF